MVKKAVGDRPVWNVISSIILEYSSIPVLFSFPIGCEILMKADNEDEQEEEGEDESSWDLRLETWERSKLTNHQLTLAYQPSS